jgi:hypothetical protein
MALDAQIDGANEHPPALAEGGCFLVLLSPCLVPKLSAIRSIEVACCLVRVGCRSERVRRTTASG